MDKGKVWGYRLTAFGLNIECDWPVSGSARVETGLPQAAPQTVVSHVSSITLDDAFNQPAERVFDVGPQQGSIRFTVDLTAEYYRLWLENFGRYLVSIDGTAICCERDGVTIDVQERFVFAQGLPVAAVLHGYEVLHASAVCGSSAAAAFLGPSGSGKTTMAVHLVLRGATLMTDDVLSIEAGPQAMVHPGPPFMAIRADDGRVDTEDLARLGEHRGSTDKLHVSPRVSEAALPLGALYHLERGSPPRIEPLREGHGPRILANAFVPYVRTAERLGRHLQIAHLISSGTAQFRLHTPSGGPDEVTLEMIEAHLREQGV